MSKNGTKLSLACPFKGNHFFLRNKMFKNFNFLSHNFDDRISNRNFVAGSGSASGIRIWIPDADPGDQNHADADPQHC